MNRKLAPESAELSRRTLLKVMAVGALGAVTGIGSTAIITQLEHVVPSRYFFFSENEADLLIAICEQIIPRDDTPGATDAGVIHFIDRQLVSTLSRHQQNYRVGLEAFRRTCQQVHRLPFEKLTFDQQTATLRLLELGKVPKELWGEPSPQAFFKLVLNHTRQGFYGSPRHGGNRNYVSFKILGVDYPQIIGQNRYVKGGL